MDSTSVAPKFSVSMVRLERTSAKDEVILSVSLSRHDVEAENLHKSTRIQERRADRTSMAKNDCRTMLLSVLIETAIRGEANTRSI